MEQEGYTQLAGNTGYLLLKIPQDILDDIKILVDGIQKDFTKASPANSTLAGQIDKEYSSHLSQKSTQYIRSLVEEFGKNNPKYIEAVLRLCKDKTPKFTYDGDSWVNFQKKYEYNPMHTHDGVFSYVIWYQVPFYKADEIKYGAGKGKNPKLNQNGEFEFIYYNGESIMNHPLSIDKTLEGYVAVFPSSLNHTVYPFYTSDDYRITVSGNLHLDNN